MNDSLLLEILEATDLLISTCSFYLSIYLSPPLSTNSHFRNNSSVTMNTCVQLATAISKRIKSYVERATQQSDSYSLAGARVQMKTNLSLSLPPFNTNQTCQTTSLSFHLLGCLFRHLNYGSGRLQLTIGYNKTHILKHLKYM